MLSKEIKELENENFLLKRKLDELKEKMEQNEVLKPKSCQYCQNYIQHYAKDGRGHVSEYVPIYAGHCTRGVPIRKGGKKNPRPDDSCPYFEIGTSETRHV